MEFSIQTLVVIVIIIIAFLLLVGLITTWSSNENTLLENLYQFFRNILTGGSLNPN